MINLKDLNTFIPYKHFKMEGFHLLKEILEQGDYLCELYLKDTYFCVALNKQSRKYVRFEWEVSLYEFLCLCFELGPAPKLFKKLIKLPVSIICNLYIRIIVYLDGFLILGKTLEETILSRDTVIYLLQNLGFVINLKKLVLHPTQGIEFLGIIIDSVEMTVSLPQENVELISKRCQDILSMHDVSIIDLAKLLGTLSPTVLAILSVPLYMRYLQRQQIHNLCLRRDYNSKVALDPLCKEELNWWISNLRLSNGRSVISHQVENLIESYASKTSQGAFCQKTSIGRVWYQAEQALHINILELMAAKFAILTFCRYKKDLAVHVQMDNQAALAYLVKMGGTRNQFIIQEAKEIWELFLANQITLTAEYLPGTLNTRANKASREMKN